MKNYRVMGIVFVILLVCMGGSLKANMIVNGGFDTDMSGWTIPLGTAGHLDGTESNPSPDGPSVYLNYTTWLSTDPAEPLVAGQTYEVSFLARILGSAGEINAVDETLYAHVNSNVNGVVAPYTVHFTSTWEEYSFQFTPTSAEAVGNYSLAFLNCAAEAGYGTGGTGYAQFGIDSVSLNAVPEPSTILLLLGGLLSTLLIRRRYR